jgi:phospholipid/cholesterol/gamma-HCH transport system permease protein
MQSLLGFFEFFGSVSSLFSQTVRSLFKRPFETKLFLEQVYFVGWRSLPLALLTALFVGMVMTLQFGLGLERFGGKIYVPRIVTLSILRELGPVFTALMVAARVGVGMASELGSMVVTQQVDALRALATSPIKKLVVPRVLACVLVLPLLTIMANVVAFTGGLIIGFFEFRMDPQFYILKSLTNLEPGDYFSGVGKTFFFGLFISLSACYYGLSVKDGTRGVGSATTRAVVAGSIAVLIGDYFLTKFFWIFESIF